MLYALQYPSRGISLVLSFVIVLSSHWRCHGATVIMIYVPPCATSRMPALLIQEIPLYQLLLCLRLKGHLPRTQRTITVVMAAWCQCGVPWLNITFSSLDCGETYALQYVVYGMAWFTKMPHHRIISACLVVAGYFTQILYYPLDWSFLFPRIIAVGTVPVCLPGHWHTGRAGLNGNKTRTMAGCGVCQISV
jgi:hypothetical protein